MNTYRSFFRDFENLAKEFNQKIDEVIEIHERLELMAKQFNEWNAYCLLYTSPSPRDRQKSRMPSSA